MNIVDVFTKIIINIYILCFSLQFYCSSVGAKLVEIETESENNFLKRHLQTTGATSNCYIFGRIGIKIRANDLTFISKKCIKPEIKEYHASEPT